MKIMISQPMHGRTKEEMQAEREFAVKQLSAEGHEIVNTIWDIDPTLPPLYYLGKCLQTMAEVDAVVFIGDWQHARGCQIEYQTALTYNKFIKIM